MPLSPSYYKTAFKAHLFDRWISRWRNQTDPLFARQTKIWFPEPSFRKTRKILALPRPQFSRVIRWITGHAFLGLQNYRTQISDTLLCRFCEEVPERADHLLLWCPRLNDLRTDCFRTRIPNLPPKWEVSWLLQFLNDDLISPLENEDDVLTYQNSDVD